MTLLQFPDGITGYSGLAIAQRQVFNPDVPVGESREPRVLTAEYGDGYIERAADGLNTDRRTFSLSWTNIATNTRLKISEFFETHKGYIAFEWVPIDETNTIKVICKTWNVEKQDAGVHSLNAEFMQVFDV